MEKNSTPIDARYKTQRADDRAHKRPLEPWMTEDPKLRGLPLFLQAQNRKGLTPEQKAHWDALRAKDAQLPARDAKRDWNRPASMSQEEWEKWSPGDAKKSREAEEAPAPEPTSSNKPKKTKSPPLTDTLKRSVIRLVSKTNPYREGSAGNTVFALYRDGMKTSDFEKKAAGLTGKRKPADMLMHDVRKGHVVLEQKGEKHDE